MRLFLRSLAGLGLLSLAGVSAAAPGQASPPVAVVRQAPVTPDPLLPDLVPLKAQDLSVVSSTGKRVLRFESGLANVGRGPIEVRPNQARRCPDGQRHATQLIYGDVDDNGWFNRSVDTRTSRRSAGCMLFHPRHDHWHFEAAAQYTLLRPSGEELVVAGRKMSFCLRDSERVPEAYGTFRQPDFYGACGRDTPQGISPGWVDVYQSFLAGQSLTLPRGTADGLYCLRTTVDPRDQLVERHDDDNASVRGLRISGTSVAVASNERCR